MHEAGLTKYLAWEDNRMG